MRAWSLIPILLTACAVVDGAGSGYPDDLAGVCDQVAVVLCERYVACGIAQPEEIGRCRADIGADGDQCCRDRFDNLCNVGTGRTSGAESSFDACLDAAGRQSCGSLPERSADSFSLATLPTSCRPDMFPFSWANTSAAAP